MEKTEPYYDFAIPYNEDQKVMRSILSELVDLGYKTIAIEQIFDHTKKDAYPKGSDIFPEPVNIQKWREEYTNKLKILQRITITYIDVVITHQMAISLNLKKFDLIAGQPKTDTALIHCCTIFEGDILTFNPTSGSKLMIKRKSYELAVKRKMFFEVKYSPAIMDSNNRKDIIKIAHGYTNRGKTKNIIFSSGASTAFELRSPCDVAHLAFIFGISESEGKNAVNRTCRHLFLQSECRRIGKTVMTIKSNGPILLSSSDEDDEEDDDDNSSDENMESVD